jgi:superfamily II DNA/RNA helicase
MLEEGFGDQVGQINKNVRADRQCLFFSATWPPQVSALAAHMCSKGAKPVRVTVGQSEGDGPRTRDDIVQEVVVFDEDTWDERDRAKQELLYAHLKEVLKSKNHKALVFVSRKTLADELTNRLWGEGFQCHSMHGGRSQDTRLNILDEFKNGELKLLVTTDVFARGIDIPDISHVVIFDMGDIEDYVHRIGRTARGPYGKGHALTFYEYDRKWPHLPMQLLEVLQASGQEVPEDLFRIANEVKMGKRSGKGLW